MACAFPQGSRRSNGALNTGRPDRVEHEEVGSLTERRGHGGERLVGMTVHGREGATQERIPGTGCNEQSLSHERPVIPHCMLRGRRGHEGISRFMFQRYFPKDCHFPGKWQVVKHMDDHVGAELETSRVYVRAWDPPVCLCEKTLPQRRTLGQTGFQNTKSGGAGAASAE